MAFTYDLTTDTGKVRLFIADTDAANYVFEDDEIAVAIAQTTSLQAAAAMLLRILAADKSRIAVRLGRGTRTEDLTQVAKEIAARAKELEDLATAAADVPLEAVITPTINAFSYRENILFDRESGVRTP